MLLDVKQTHDIVTHLKVRSTVWFAHDDVSRHVDMTSLAELAGRGRGLGSGTRPEFRGVFFQVGNYKL